MPYRPINRSECGAIKSFGRRFDSVDDAVKREVAELLPALRAALGDPIRYRTTHHVDATFLGWSHHGIPDGATTVVIEVAGYGNLELARYDEDEKQYERAAQARAQQVGDWS